MNPVDSAQDLRGEMLGVMGELGLKPEKHHHEVAPAQHELGLKFAELITMADRLQLYKYVVHNVAAPMARPRPSWPSRCSPTTVRACTSTSRSGTPVSAVRGRQVRRAVRHVPALHRRHHQARQAINAFTNSTTNSYKRLVPGYEAPVKLAYSARNRSARSVSRTAKAQGQAHRSPVPDPWATLPRLHGHADGRPRRHRKQARSGAPADKNLYDLPPREQKKIPEVCGSLREALENSTRIAPSSKRAA